MFDINKYIKRSDEGVICINPVEDDTPISLTFSHNMTEEEKKNCLKEYKNAVLKKKISPSFAYIINTALKEG